MTTATPPTNSPAVAATRLPITSPYRFVFVCSTLLNAEFPPALYA